MSTNEALSSTDTSYRGVIYGDGTGGTVKDGNIELQGDQRERAGEEMGKMNYAVK